jgi:SPP1 family phage portal protein
MEQIFRLPADVGLTPEKLSDFIKKNDDITKERYKKLWDAYNNDFTIYHKKAKARWKPDARMSANFAQYIVDTFEGFFVGNPIRTTSDDEATQAFIDAFESENDIDDKQAELSSIVSIFGRGYEMYYLDEDAEIRTTYLDPMESFMIYDDAITPHPLYFVRYYVDSSDNHIRRGSVSDAHSVFYFEYHPDLHFTGEEHIHGFSYVPATEYVMNRARRGIFENVLPMINSFNEALSEKMNDVSYFADAYLKILGATLDEQTLNFLRDNRVINLEGDGADKIVAEFLQKPDGDSTQEHLLDRLQQLIFVTSMVCNISDENFATSSGIALKYKLLPMLNLAKRKERKFTSGMNRRYKILCSHPLCPLQTDAYRTIKYTFTPNLPANIDDEASTAQKLSGITSRETQLSVLSVVDNIADEMERIKAEDMEELTEYPLNRGGSDESDENDA